MQTRGADTSARPRKGSFRALTTTLGAAVAVLAGLGVLVTPAVPAGATGPPAQGWTTTEAPLPADAGTGSTNPDVYTVSSARPAANGCVTAGWYYDTADKAWGRSRPRTAPCGLDTEAPQPSNVGSGANQGFWFGSRNAASAPRAVPCRVRARPSASRWGNTWTPRDTASP